MRRKSGAATIALLLLGVAACGNATEPGIGDAPRPPVWVEPACPETEGPALGAPMPDRGGIPADFTTAGVLRCRTEIRDMPGEGTWNVQLTERADTDAADLVAELRRPSDPPTSDGVCDLSLVLPPYFLLVDGGGRALLPAVPTDVCAKPRRQVLDLLDRLAFHVVSERRQGQVHTPRSAQTGCPDRRKDTIGLDPGRRNGQAVPAQPVWPSPPEAVQVCVYDRISGGELPVGELDGAHTITGADATTVHQALGGAGPAAACSTPHTRFAALSVKGVAAMAVVELDGCLRLERPDGSFGQLDAATIALIAR